MGCRCASGGGSVAAGGGGYSSAAVSVDNLRSVVGGAVMGGPSTVKPGADPAGWIALAVFAVGLVVAVA